MPAEIVAVIAGSIHCGENCDCRAAMSPMNVEIALTVACRLIPSPFRFICIIRATAIAALTAPQTEAMRTCSKPKAVKKLPRDMTRMQENHAPKNFSAADRATTLSRKAAYALQTL
jgi:hypothetical protein